MAEQFLSQDEVDALLEGMGQNSDQGDENKISVKDYDIATSERIVRGRMPTMEIINERLARSLRIALFNFIRKNPDISVGPVKVQKYSEFLRNLVVPTNINMMALKPLRGSALLVCEPRLVFTVIDSIFGGNGRLQTRIEGRDFSPTEQRIIQKLVDLYSEEFKKAWAQIYPLELEYQRSEMQPQFATVATPSEFVVTTSFGIEMGEGGGHMIICIPYATLEPIRDIIYSAVQGDQQVADSRWVTLLTQQIKSAEVEMVAEFAHATMRIEDLLSLKKGDFVEMTLKESIVTKVAGVPIFQCGFGVSNKRYSIQIEEILTLQSEETSENVPATNQDPGPVEN
jgi:flagellar motor switch protein FliM